MLNLAVGLARMVFNLYVIPASPSICFSKEDAQLAASLQSRGSKDEPTDVDYRVSLPHAAWAARMVNLSLLSAGKVSASSLTLKVIFHLPSSGPSDNS